MIQTNVSQKWNERDVATVVWPCFDTFLKGEMNSWSSGWLVNTSHSCNKIQRWQTQVPLVNEIKNSWKIHEQATKIQKKKQKKTFFIWAVLKTHNRDMNHESILVGH